MSKAHEQLRELPKIDELMRREDLAAIEGPRWALRETLRDAVEARRRGILAGEAVDLAIGADEVKASIGRRLRPSLVPVINATGVILHTNLGRAPLHPEVAARAAEIAGSYSNLEYDVERGHRGSRHSHATALLQQLTGAEDAVVVNNNAGAVMLGLAALAHDREVIVSRGELVEIGGSFRVPDVMRLSGARLVEVGTTNKTRIADFDAEVGDETALLLQVHRSNFAVVGFAEDTPLAELVALAKERGCRAMIDLGSGAFIEGATFASWGLPAEPSVSSVVASGVHLCTFSGDKLLGGPQAGILVGDAETIGLVRSHPLMRALRPDKMTLAALCATLELYRDGRAHEVPTCAMLSASADDLRARADELAESIGPLGRLSIEVVPCDSAVGGGAMPLGKLSSMAVAVGGAAAHVIDDRLRACQPSVVGRIHDERFLLDVRTLFDRAQREAVARALQSIDEESPE